MAAINSNMKNDIIFALT